MKEGLFQYINPDQNTRLSELSEKELKHLLSLLKHYQLELRPQLSLPQEVTFGVEIEFGCLYQEDPTIYEKIKKELEQCDKKWELKEEVTNYGLEITSNILTDKKRTWKKLKQVCEMISQYGGETALSGGHVHVGSHLFQQYDQCFDFVKLLTAYENILYRFGYGEYYGAKTRLWYAQPMREYWESVIACGKEEKIPGFALRVSPRTEQSVNLKVFRRNYQAFEQDNTIEFRFPNGTLNPIIWQNNINVFTKMMLYVKNEYVNHEILDARIMKNHKLKPISVKLNKTRKAFPLEIQNMEEYEKIDLEQALEFSDLIFDNNLDKLNFLRQYFKNGKTSKKKFQKIKNLTR